MVSPALERLARRHAGHLKLVNINVDEALDIAQRFAVQGIPINAYYEVLPFRFGLLLTVGNAVGRKARHQPSTTSV
jgi:hypothetical protein